MTVKDLARTDVVTADPDTPLGDLATTMRDEGVGSVVVTEGNRPAGIVTDRDLAIRAFAAGNGAGLSARDVMTPEPTTVEADAGIFELTNVMCEEGVRRVPVVEKGALVGIVTLDDLMVLLTTEMDNLASVVVEESPPY